MGRHETEATKQALRHFIDGDSITVAAAKAGIESTTLIRAIQRALKIALKEKT